MMICVISGSDPPISRKMPENVGMKKASRKISTPTAITARTHG